MAELYDGSILNFFEKASYCFPCVCTNLHDYEQGTRVSFSPHPCQDSHLFLAELFLLGEVMIYLKLWF
jgi:hypothetical protein